MRTKGKKDLIVFICIPYRCCILENLSPFERLLWDGWMPVMRKIALRWNPRDDPQSMLHVVEKWLPLLPLWMRENLLEQVSSKMSKKSKINSRNLIILRYILDH